MLVVTSWYIKALGALTLAANGVQAY